VKYDSYVGHQQDVQKRKKKRFRKSPFGVRHPSAPSSTGARIAVYFAFRTFLFALRTSVEGGGECPKGQFLLGRL